MTQSDCSLTGSCKQLFVGEENPPGSFHGQGNWNPFILITMIRYNNCRYCPRCFCISASIVAVSSDCYIFLFSRRERSEFFKNTFNVFFCFFDVCIDSLSVL